MTTQKWIKIRQNREYRETWHLQRGTRKSETLENLEEKERVPVLPGMGSGIEGQDSVDIYRTYGLFLSNISLFFYIKNSAFYVIRWQYKLINGEFRFFYASPYMSKN